MGCYLSNRQMVHPLQRFDTRDKLLPDNLVFAGTSYIKRAAYIGALQRMYEHKLLKNVKNYAGTGVGQ